MNKKQKNIFEGHIRQLHKDITDLVREKYTHAEIIDTCVMLSVEICMLQPHPEEAIRSVIDMTTEYANFHLLLKESMKN